MTHSSAYSQKTSSESNSIEPLARTFNTALIATHSRSDSDVSNEIYQLMETPSFRAILSAVKELERSTGATDQEAAESVIQTFRRLDQLWSRYLLQEGTDRLRNATQENA